PPLLHSFPTRRSSDLDEEQRLSALHRYQLLDTPAEDDFDFLTELAAHVCGTPYAFVSLVDRDRVWIKSYFGMKAQSRPRDDDYRSEEHTSELQSQSNL